LTVQNLLEHRQAQLKKEEKESGTKQPDTELTDRLDRWQQHLNDLDKLEELDKASKDAKAEARIQAWD
jgi:hypothetical protein